MIGYCVCCGQPLELHPPGFGWYCSVRCAELQLRTIGALLHSSPELTLTVLERRELGSSYASDLEALELQAVRPAAAGVGQ
jgi:hypothetical protein